MGFLASLDATGARLAGWCTLLVAVFAALGGQIIASVFFALAGIVVLLAVGNRAEMSSLSIRSFVSTMMWLVLIIFGISFYF